MAAYKQKNLYDALSQTVHNVAAQFQRHVFKVQEFNEAIAYFVWCKRKF